MLVCPLISKHIELFKNLSFFCLRTIAYEHDFLYTECTGTTDYVTNVVTLAYVMKQKIGFGVLHINSINIKFSFIYDLYMITNHKKKVFLITDRYWQKTTA